MIRTTSSWLSAAHMAAISSLLTAFTSADAKQFDTHNLGQVRPLYFTENKGQWDDHVLFKADGAGGLTWWIEREGFTVLFSVADTTSKSTTDTRSVGLPEEMRRFDAADRYPNNAHALKFKFQFALSSPAGKFLPEQTTPATASSFEPSERLSWNNNYFIGNDGSKWAPDCGNFQRVVLKDVWDGVDVLWRGVGKSVEFDFVVTPGADASQIRVECLGLTGELEATADGGELLLPTLLGVLRQALPEAYQTEPDGQMHEVKATFKVEGGNSFGVALLEGYDSFKPLIIDPLIYSRVLGGARNDNATGLAPDADGGVIVVGTTQSNDFPTTEGAYDVSHNGAENIADVFITGLSEDGNDILYSTYLGGESSDEATGITPDGAGGVILVGATESNDFPTTDAAFDRALGGNRDGFASRLSADGRELIFSTYLGGERGDRAHGVMSDEAEGVVIAGETYSNDFPTTEGVFDESFNGGIDCFSTRLNDEGSALIYSTFLGGRSNEVVYAVSSDITGGVFLTGYTSSSDFPTSEGAFDRSYYERSGFSDVFVARLNADGSELLFSTFAGGRGTECGTSISSDGGGGALIVGTTDNDDFPTTEGAFDRAYNGHLTDAFIIRLNDDGSELLLGTFLGGGLDEAPCSVTLDGAGGIIVAGSTTSDDFPTTEDAYQREFCGAQFPQDAFIIRLNRDGSNLLYSTYFALGDQGEVSTSANALSLDGSGGVVIAGSTNGSDSYVARLGIGLPALGWVEMPDIVESIEGTLLLLDVRGESINDSAGLTLSYNSDNIPGDAVEFSDNADGSGSFSWEVTYEDSGRYTAVFTLSNGVDELAAEVSIIIHNVNRAPSSFRLSEPLDRSPIPPDSLVLFAWNTSSDADHDALAYTLVILGGQGTLTSQSNDTTAWVERRQLLELLTEGRSLRWEVWAKDGQDSTVCDTAFNLRAPLDVEDALPIPKTMLLTPYPNPFNATTRFDFSMREASYVSIRIYDVAGRELATLVSGELSTGNHIAVWNAEDFTSGIYLVKMETAGFSATKKVTLVR